MTTLTTRSAWTVRIFRGIIPLLVAVFIAGFFVRESDATVVIYRVSERSISVINEQPLSGNKAVGRFRERWKGYAVIHIETMQVKMVYTEKTKDSKKFSIWDDFFIDSGAFAGKHSLLRKHARVRSTHWGIANERSEHVYEIISGKHRPDQLPFPSTLKRIFNVELAAHRATVSTGMRGTWRLDRKLSRRANTDDDEPAFLVAGNLARGLDEVRNVLESKGYVDIPGSVTTPESQLVVIKNFNGTGTVIDSTFYE